MAQTEQHPVFAGKLVARNKRPFLSHCRNLLSKGCINYYLNDSEWKTRVFIHNYFSLLNGGQYPANWEMRLYKSDGTLAQCFAGVFSGPETAVVELGEVSGLDTYGLIHMQIRERGKDVMLGSQYSSVFFPEYYVPGTKRQVMAHCLSGTPKATHFTAVLETHTVKTPPNFRPYLLIASSCRYQKFVHPACGTADLTVVNQRGIKKTITIPPLKGLACHKLDLFASFPGLAEHIGHEHYSIYLQGHNILHRPVLLQTDGKVVLSEHL